jgi:hypothetical protein
MITSLYTPFGNVFRDNLRYGLDSGAGSVGFTSDFFVTAYFCLNGLHKVLDSLEPLVFVIFMVAPPLHPFFELQVIEKRVASLISRLYAACGIFSEHWRSTQPSPCLL